MGNPLNWSSADKCLLVTAAVMPFTLWNYLILRWASEHPEAAPYFDQAVLAQVARLHALGWFGAWCLIAVVALFVRRRHPQSRLLVGATVQVYCLGASFFSWTMGSFTAPYVAAMALLGFAVGMIFFDRRQVLHGVATFMGVIAVGTVADQLGVVPYAPALREAPFTGGRLHPSWLAGMGVFGFTITLFGLALIYFIVLQWGADREEKLAAASEQLGRVNDLVSRFIAAQVAEESAPATSAPSSGTTGGASRSCSRTYADFSDTADRIEPEGFRAAGRVLRPDDGDRRVRRGHGRQVHRRRDDGLLRCAARHRTSPTTVRAVPHRHGHAGSHGRPAGALESPWNRRAVRHPHRNLNTGVADVGAVRRERAQRDYTAEIGPAGRPGRAPPGGQRARAHPPGAMPPGHW